jgi:hypothetical protein
MQEKITRSESREASVNDRKRPMRSEFHEAFGPELEAD